MSFLTYNPPHLFQLSSSERVQTLHCQILSELGQFYCWDGDYVQALKYLDRCHEIHKQHAATSQGFLGCHLDVHRTTALSNLSRLAAHCTMDDVKGQLMSRVKALEQEERHAELVDVFQKDNVTRLLPFTWRQRLLQNVINRSDMENGAFLAVANALYNPQGPSKYPWFIYPLVAAKRRGGEEGPRSLENNINFSKSSAGEMMLEIPSRVLLYLRSVTFESGHEADAYHSSSIFEDLMQYIVKIQESYSTSNGSTNGVPAGFNNNVRIFVSKLCTRIQHVLCYEAAWISGKAMESCMIVSINSCNRILACLLLAQLKFLVHHMIYIRFTGTIRRRLEFGVGHV